MSWETIIFGETFVIFEHCNDFSIVGKTKCFSQFPKSQYFSSLYTIARNIWWIRRLDSLSTPSYRKFLSWFHCWILLVCTGVSSPHHYYVFYQYRYQNLSTWSKYFDKVDWDKLFSLIPMKSVYCFKWPYNPYAYINSCLTGIIFFYIGWAIVFKFSTDKTDYKYKTQTGSVTSNSSIINFVYKKGARSTAPCPSVVFNHKVTLHYKKWNWHLG